MENQVKKLFNEFPPISTQQWEEQIQKDLKGADYEKKLIWRTNEGINVKPYYRAEHLENIQWVKAFPGDFPFVRGNSKTGNEWLVRQDIYVDDIKTANEKALELLMKGIDSLGFELDCKKKYSIDDIESLLKNIRADIAEINFFHTSQQIELVAMMDNLVRKYNRPLEKITGSVDFDPLMRFAKRGVWYNNDEADLNLAYELIKAGKAIPNFKVITVNGHVFANAGASLVQEMAFTLAAGSEYLTRLTDKGLFIGEVAPRIKFNLAVGSNYFMEMAKLRAYRLLWAHIVNAYGLNDALNGRMYIHAENTSWNYTVYDSHVNMLRSTTGTMSAILGSVDSFKVMPYNSPYEKPTEFSERIARNQQLILKEESYFNKVADPAAGSYYIENLTNLMAEEAWKIFLKINEEGGFIKALRSNTIQQTILESASKRDLNIATRREILLGTNQYPNMHEKLSIDLEKNVLNVEDKTNPEAEIETIKTYRGAQAIEVLRYATDVFSRTNQRPKVWMFTYGNLAMRKARATFASNFFACAGFEIIDNYGFKTIEEGIQKVRDEKPEIVVICSSDEEYTDNASLIFKALKDETIVTLAGYPIELVDILKASGMQYFIHVKSNVLETLVSLQKRLGIHE